MNSPPRIAGSKESTRDRDIPSSPYLIIDTSSDEETSHKADVEESPKNSPFLSNLVVKSSDEGSSNIVESVHDRPFSTILRVDNISLDSPLKTDKKHDSNVCYPSLATGPGKYSKQWLDTFTICCMKQRPHQKLKNKTKKYLRFFFERELKDYKSYLAPNALKDKDEKNKLVTFVSTAFVEFAKLKRKQDDAETMWYYINNRMKDYFSNYETSEKPMVQINLKFTLSPKSEMTAENAAKKKPRKEPINSRPKNDKTQVKKTFELPPECERNSAMAFSGTRDDIFNSKIQLITHKKVKILFGPRLPISKPAIEFGSVSLTMKQLLNWPGLQIRLKLNDLVISRSTHANYKYDMVLGNDAQINITKKAQSTEYRCIKNHFKACPTILSGRMIKTYLKIFLNTRHLMGSSANEIMDIIDSLLEDLEPMQSVKLKAHYSRFLSPFVYFQAFHNPDDETCGSTPAYFRQTLNPELVISVERCSFVRDVNERSWLTDLHTLFTNLFVNKSPNDLAAQTTMLRSSVSISCLECDWSVTGMLAVFESMRHIMTHTRDERLICNGCGLKNDLKEWTAQFWMHNCTVVK